MVTQIVAVNCPYYPPSTPLTPEERRQIFFARLVNAYNNDYAMRNAVDKLLQEEIERRQKDENKI